MPHELAPDSLHVVTEGRDCIYMDSDHGLVSLRRCWTSHRTIELCLPSDPMEAACALCEHRHRRRRPSFFPLRGVLVQAPAL